MSRRSKKLKFRSNFEETVSKVLKEFEYEPYRIPYTIHRHYCPDFAHDSSGTLVECKGFFREGDTKKYTSVRDSLPGHQRLVFVLMNPDKKVRKGGKLTMAQWCERENIKWYNVDTLQELIEDVSNT
tara:strand:- start:179 stop:559 length:381 start_codon:yes stop_codon:yes gene_type:complete